MGSMIALILTTLITVDAHDDGRTIRAAKGATVVFLRALTAIKSAGAAKP